MKAFAFLYSILLAASVISATETNLIRRQDISGSPYCGQVCLLKAASTKGLLGKCSIRDEKCLCKNEPFQASVRQCVVKSCSSADQLKVISWDDKTCPGQNLSSLPACGQLCLLHIVANKEILHGCAGTDNACLCQNQAFRQSATQCVFSSCDFPGMLSMLSWQSNTCGGYSSGGLPF